MSFYKYITEKRKDSPELKKTMEAVTKDLLKYKTDDSNKQYYLGLHIGRFYQPNSQNPDINYHPDQLHNKNSLDIINDILYYYTTII